MKIGEGAFAAHGGTQIAERMFRGNISFHGPHRYACVWRSKRDGLYMTKAQRAAFSAARDENDARARFIILSRHGPIDIA